MADDPDGLGAAFLRSVGQVAADNPLRAIDARATVDPHWRDAMEFSDDLLTLTPVEAKALGAEIHALLRAWRAAGPDAAQDRPADAARVSVQFQLFPHLDEDPQ